MKLSELYLREAAEEEPDASKKVEPVEPVEPVEDEEDLPTEEDTPEEGDPEEGDEPEEESVGTVAEEEGFSKSTDTIDAFGKSRKVTLLTKDETLGGMDLTLQYVINPSTGAWSLRACLAGQTAEDMVEFATGEDPSSLIKHLRKKKKITPHQAVEYLHPAVSKKVAGDAKEEGE